MANLPALGTIFWPDLVSAVGTVPVIGEGRAPQPPQLDRRRLLQDGARGEALDLGQEALDAAAAVGAGQVQAAQGGQKPVQVGAGGAGVGGGAGIGGCHLKTPRGWGTDPGVVQHRGRGGGKGMFVVCSG